MFMISPVTQEQVDTLAKELSNSSGDVSLVYNGDSKQYSIGGHGITARASLDGGILTVFDIHKPFYIKESMIEDVLKTHLLPPVPVPVPAVATK